ncbi:MAG: hypothetical protein K9J13_11615 [Saprospiraceae bacterium]|nr:hypothetical protein [Saprospiraceae bacterium]
MSQFNFELNIVELEEADYLLTTQLLEPEAWSPFDDEPIVTVKDEITYITIRLIEDGEIVPEIEIPLMKPENAQYIIVTVFGVNAEGHELDEPQPGKNKINWD